MGSRPKLLLIYFSSMLTQTSFIWSCQTRDPRIFNSAQIAIRTAHCPFWRIISRFRMVGRLKCAIASDLYFSHILMPDKYSRWPTRFIQRDGPRIIALEIPRDISGQRECPRIIPDICAKALAQIAIFRALLTF